MLWSLWVKWCPVVQGDQDPVGEVAHAVDTNGAGDALPGPVQVIERVGLRRPSLAVGCRTRGNLGPRLQLAESHNCVKHLVITRPT